MAAKAGGVGFDSPSSALQEVTMPELSVAQIVLAAGGAAVLLPFLGSLFAHFIGARR